MQLAALRGVRPADGSAAGQDADQVVEKVQSAEGFWARRHLDFVAGDLDFVARGLETVALDLRFVASDLEKLSRRRGSGAGRFRGNICRGPSK
jgi:hypothetical protein